MSDQIAGEFNTTPATFGSGQKINVQTDSQGRLLLGGTGTAGSPAGPVQSVQEVGAQLTAIQAMLVALTSTDPVQVFTSNSYTRLLDTQAAIKSGTGTFYGFTVSAAGTTITVNVYDSLTAAGTVIFGPYVLVAGAAITMPGGGLAFGTGLSIGFSATTGTPSIVAAYR